MGLKLPLLLATYALTLEQSNFSSTLENIKEYCGVDCLPGYSSQQWICIQLDVRFGRWPDPQQIP